MVVFIEGSVEVMVEVINSVFRPVCSPLLGDRSFWERS